MNLKSAAIAAMLQGVLDMPAEVSHPARRMAAWRPHTLQSKAHLGLVAKSRGDFTPWLG